MTLEFGQHQVGFKFGNSLLSCNYEVGIIKLRINRIDYIICKGSQSIGHQLFLKRFIEKAILNVIQT